MSDNALTTTVENKVMAVDYKQKAADYLRATGTNLNDNQMNMFVEIAGAFGLNPFKREIYAVKYGDKFNIITGYEVYIKRAERSGKLAGWNCKVEGRGDDMTATITIYRKDWQYPFTHTVYWGEAKGDSPIWKKMPSHMLRKVAISQGFRMCFPDELGGMPYTDDEIAGGEPIERNITGTADDVKYEVKDAEPQTEPSVSEMAIEAIMNEHGHLIGGEAKKALDDLIREKKFVQALTRLKSYLEKKGVKL